MDLTDTLLCDGNDIKCGEMFLTMAGNIVIHCTLCDRKFYRFHHYCDHIEEEHMSEKEHEDEILAIDVMVTSSNVDFVKYEIEVLDGGLGDVEEPNKAIEKSLSLSKLSDTSIQQDSVVPSNEKNQRQENTITRTVEEKKILNRQNSASLLNSLQEIFPMGAPKKKVARIETGDQKDNNSSTNKTDEWRKSYKVVSFQYKDDSTGKVTDQQRYECTVCATVIKDKSNVVSHLRRHFDEKRYKCPDCDNSYHKPSELRAHRRRHKGEKPFLCPDCGKSFYTSGQLKSHTATHYKLETKKCPICQKELNINNARRHMLVHTDERPLKCEICSAAFKCRKALRTHTRNIHENKHAYQCHICSARYNYKISLNYHIKSKHGQN